MFSSSSGCDPLRGRTDPAFARVCDQRGTRTWAAPNVATLPRIMLLYSRIAPDHPRRSSLVELAAMAQLTSGPVDELNADDLSSSIGFQSADASNLTSASEVRTVAEVVEMLAGSSGQKRRALRMRLALTQTSEAEEMLTSEFASASDPGDLSELLEALATLGTLRARNTVLDRLDVLSDSSELLIKALRMLRSFPIDEGIENILGLVKSGNLRTVRIEAALVAGEHCRTPRLTGFLTMRKHNLKLMWKSGKQCYNHLRERARSGLYAN